MVEQRLVRLPRALLMDVVGMDVKTDQTMFLGDESDLSFPQFDRIIVQNMEERVVLCRCQRKFEDLADEIRHNSAAAAPLRVQVRDIGDGHVIGEVQCVVPVQVSIEHSGPKATRPEVLPILTNSSGTAQELPPVPKQVSVVIQVVHIDLESPLSNIVEKS